MSHFADKCTNRVSKIHSYKIMLCTESKLKLSRLIAFENIRNRIKAVLVLQGIGVSKL